jgi:hypothetical protein
MLFSTRLHPTFEASKVKAVKALASCAHHGIVASEKLLGAHTAGTFECTIEKCSIFRLLDSFQVHLSSCCVQSLLRRRERQ